MKFNRQLSNLDSAQSVFFSRDLEHILARTFDVEYPELKSRMFVPPSPEPAPSGAETITYRKYDRVGMAKVLANYAGDIPLSDVHGTEHTSKVRGLAAGFAYNLQEVRAAAMANKPLTSDRAKAARDAIEELIDEIIAVGDSETGLVGFLNNSNVPQADVATVDGLTTFAEKLESDPDLVVDDVTDMIADMIELTKGKERPNTILLPEDQFARIKLTRLVDQHVTVLKWLQEANPEITFAPWYRLTGAGDGGSDRMVAYRRDPSKLFYEVPQEFEALDIQESGFVFKVPCHARVGGTIIPKPLSVSYRDGI